MIHAQKEKTVVLINQALTSAGTAAAAVDCKGWSYCTIDVYPGIHTTAKIATLTLSEGDTTSSYATFSGCVAATDYTIPDLTAITALTDGATAIRFGVDCRKRKRYLKLSFEAGTGQAMPSLAVVARLSRGDEAPDTDAKSNCAEIALV